MPTRTCATCSCGPTQYERVKAVFQHEDREYDPREAYPFVEEVMREDDANDPSPQLPILHEAGAVMRRGDIVIVAFPYVTGGAGKIARLSSFSATVIINGSQIRSWR